MVRVSVPPVPPARARFVAAIVGVLLLAGCASGAAKPSPAGDHVDAVMHVLDGMAEGLKARNTTALASQWDPSVREAARARIRAGIAAGGGGDVRLTPVSVRAEGDRLVTRVLWERTRKGRIQGGTFEMELTGEAPPAIVAMRGEEPFGGPPPPP